MTAQTQNLPSFASIISVLSIVFYCVGFFRVELQLNEQKDRITALESVAETKSLINNPDEKRIKNFLDIERLRQRNRRHADPVNNVTEAKSRTEAIITVKLLSQLCKSNGDTCSSGPPGPPGPRGRTGARGRRGQKGRTGNKGDIGIMGSSGKSGKQGFMGSVGSKGESGAKGVKGDTGNPGMSGSKGDRGPTGMPGSKGDRGATGIPGTKGDRGPTGTPGSKGDGGATGIPGTEGDRGPTGTPGSKGDRGATGMPGSKEEPGISMPYRDCSYLFKSGFNQSGVYSIDPDGKGPFDVYCDMRTDGGGWTVFQRRQDGSVDFYRGWNDYKAGFGQLTAEFWLGNDKIHRLTASRPSSLRVELEDWNGVKVYAKYGKFNIGDEQALYRLEVGSYSGTAGDSLVRSHNLNNMAFSTKDRDNDRWSSGNCAVSTTGAWWYNKCQHSHLNAKYLGEITKSTGIVWFTFRSWLSLKFTEMKLRPS